MKSSAMLCKICSSIMYLCVFSSKTYTWIGYVCPNCGRVVTIKPKGKNYAGRKNIKYNYRNRVNGS